MKELRLDLETVIATQAATTDATEPILGKLYAIRYVNGTIDTGATLTITCRGYKLAAKPLLTLASADDCLLYPRDIVHAVADGSVLSSAVGGDMDAPIVQGWIRAVIASGGGTTARIGQVYIYWEPL